MKNELGILRVNALKKPPYSAKIYIRSPLLADFGVTYGTPVFAIPEHEGFTLSFNNENGANGKWINAGIDGNRPAVCLFFSKNFSPGGLSDGDFLVAKFDYGSIYAKKLPDAQKYFIVGSRDYEAHLLLTGAYLADSGFTPGAVTVVSAKNGTLTLNLWNDSTASYGNLVKLSRERKEQIIQPHIKHNAAVLNIPSFILKNAGFSTGDISGVRCQYGNIKLFKPDLKKLGF